MDTNQSCRWLPIASVSALNGAGYDGDSGGWVPASFSLAAYENQNARFRFIFKSDGGEEGEGWFIDDVRTSGFVENAGKVNGTVTSSNAGLDFTKVLVQNSQKWGGHPDAEGAYTLYLPMGTHQLEASSPGYNTNSFTGIVLTTTTPSAIQDFYLGYYNPPTNLSYTTNTTNTDTITLSWTAPDEPEYQIAGYSIYRKINANRFELCAVVNETTFTDPLGIHGSYTYYVVCNYLQGNSLATNHVEYQYSVGIEDENNSSAVITCLMNNYPNPFNPETTFRFSIKESSPTRLSIYNLKGQLVRRLVDQDLPAGTHQIVWNGRDTANRSVASGVYLYRLESKDYSHTKRAILMK